MPCFPTDVVFAVVHIQRVCTKNLARISKILARGVLGARYPF
jgi:hypothetical protein